MLAFELPNLNKLNIKNNTGCFIQQIVDALSIGNIQIIIYRLGRTCSVCESAMPRFSGSNTGYSGTLFIWRIINLPFVLLQLVPLLFIHYLLLKSIVHGESQKGLSKFAHSNKVYIWSAMKFLLKVPRCVEKANIKVSAIWRLEDSKKVHFNFVVGNFFSRLCFAVFALE